MILTFQGRNTVLRPLAASTGYRHRALASRRSCTLTGATFALAIQALSLTLAFLLASSRQRSKELCHAWGTAGLERVTVPSPVSTYSKDEQRPTGLGESDSD